MMMREILFRGKHLDTGNWVKGSMLTIGEESWIVVKDDGICGWKSYNIDPATVGQYTGLKDKNGKRIFEGDILRHNVQGDILVNFGVVNWDESNSRWAYQLNTMNPCFYMYKPAAYEVIGNVHDNPELVERKSNEADVEYSSGNRSICFGDNRSNFDRCNGEQAMNKIELKPCPFCGGEAVLFVLSEGGICVKCWKCDATSKVSIDSRGFSRPTNATQRVIEAWNRRASDD